MIRSRLATLKFIASAIFWLIALVCGVEIALQVRTTYDSASRLESANEASAVIPTHQVGQILKPLVRHNVSQGDGQTPISWSTNSLGLRGPEWPTPKPTGVFRIVCLGDETILAPDTAEPQTTCSQLQALLQSRTRYRVEVVNAGVPGSCPLLAYLLARHRLMALQPDLILLNFDMSDVADDHRNRRYAVIGPDGLPVACSSPQLDVARQPPVKTICERFELAKLSKTQLERLLPQGGMSSETRDIDSPMGTYAWLKDDPPEWSVYIRQALAPIEHLRTLAAGYRVRYLVATYPAPWQVSPEASNGPGVRTSAGVAQGEVFQSRTPFEILAGFAESNQIPFLDTSGAFQSATEPARFYRQNAPRFSALGHEYYAQLLAAFVMAQVPGIWTDSSSPLPQPPISGRQQQPHASNAAQPGERLARPQSAPLLRRAPLVGGSQNRPPR